MVEFRGFWRWFAHLFERWPPGVPPDPNKSENVSIFNPKTNIFQIKKAGIPSCLFKHICKENRRHSTKKGQHSVLFLKIFGEKTDDTVPTK